ncbi:hypothetical protein ES703_125152 [subsurface metagenome]
MFLNSIMVVGLSPLANLSGRPINTIGQNISNPFSPNNFVKQPEESLLVIGRKSGQVLVSQNASLIKLKGKGHNLRGCVSVHSILLSQTSDFKTKIQVGHGRHCISKFRVAFHHVSLKFRVGNYSPAFHRTVIATY